MTLYVGEGPRGSNGTCSTLCPISATPSTSQNQIGPLWCWFPMGGLVHALGTCGSLQRPLLWGWEFLPLQPQPPQVFSIRGLRLYFPNAGGLGCEVCFAPCRFLPIYLCGNVGPRGLLPTCPISPTVCQSRSWSHSGNAVLSTCPSPPLLPVWMNVSFLSSWCWTSLPFDFLSVLFVQGGAVCLPTPPSWFSNTPVS